MSEKKPQPSSINLHKKSRILTVLYDDGTVFDLSCEYLRVHSPSAEVLGHGPGQEILQIGKEDVAINDIEPVGNYGIKPNFDDGHDSGIYSWDYLYELGQKYDEKWQAYLSALERAGQKRKDND